RPNVQIHPLLPKPRERKDYYMAYLVMAVCVFILYLLEHPWNYMAEYLTLHVTAQLISALLKGFCSFAEEIWHVSSSKEKPKWRVDYICLELLVHVLSRKIIFQIQEFLLQILWNTINICCKWIPDLAGWVSDGISSFNPQRPSAVEMSEICEKNNRNVAHGLAWSYYVGYLKFVLPRLKDLISEFNRDNKNLLACKETWKLHILLPLSCEIYNDLEKADSHIQYCKDLPELVLDRAGTKRRVYKQSIYGVMGEDKKLSYCVVEYATPLQSLYAMSQDESAAFSRQDRLEQAQLFCRTLEEILQSSKECAGCYRLVVYEDSGDSNSHFLSKELLRHIRQQHLEEYAMCNGSHQPATFLSEEPVIMISNSELPGPLRSDGF
uniref:Stimulator of interferon genes protein n=1 Tax=Pelodiscus sinensis TaxID=13735 RepID=K7G3W1_PELSI